MVAARYLSTFSNEDIVMLMPIISADSHVSEPPNCYIDHIAPAFRERAPRVVHDEKRGDMFHIEGSKTPIPMSLVSAAGKDARELSAEGAVFEKLHRGGWEPHARIGDQDKDGVAAEIIYPSVGMELCNIPDIDLKQACMEAYNRWLAEFCAPYPHRLIGLGQCAVKTPGSGIKELESIKSFGFKGVMLPGFPGTAEDYSDESFTEFFAAMVELELVPSFHILTAGDGLTRGFRGSKINSFMSIVRSNQDLMSMFVFDGVFMRHPKLKIVSAEADGGWVPHYMYRMDHAYDRHRHWMRGRELDKRPSEYFRDNIYFTFQDDYTAFRFKDYMNIERMMWANDFPHSDSTWPWSQSIIAEQTAHLSEVEKNKVLSENVAQLYGLETRFLLKAA
jgi:predicted TIM-barrel fold metal-dependent hydrolase